MTPIRNRGADTGIDGYIYFFDGSSGNPKKIIVLMKIGRSSRPGLGRQSKKHSSLRIWPGVPGGRGYSAGSSVQRGVVFMAATEACRRQVG